MLLYKVLINEKSGNKIGKAILQTEAPAQLLNKRNFAKRLANHKDVKALQVIIVMHIL